MRLPAGRIRDKFVAVHCSRHARNPEKNLGSLFDQLIVWFISFVYCLLSNVFSVARFLFIRYCCFCSVYLKITTRVVATPSGCEG